MPRVVAAAVPSRTPLVWLTGRVSNGMAFLLAVMCAASSSSCTCAPFLPRLSTSISIRWLSVPPETRRTPPFCRVSARTEAFFTTWWA